MDALQDLQLPASALTFTPDGQPLAPPASHPVVIPPLSTLENVDSTATNLVDTILTIVKEVSQIFQHLPYIKGLSGVILQIIRIKEVRVVVVAYERFLLVICRKFKQTRVNVRKSLTKYYAGPKLF
jgi:hypothetical protein